MPGATRFITTTENSLSGYRVVERMGVVRGIAVRSRSMFGRIGARIQQLGGGQITLLTVLCEQARSDAFTLVMQTRHRAILGAAIVLLGGAGGAGAQATPAEASFTTRVAAVGDAEVCACDESFLQTPRSRQLVMVALGRRYPLGATGRWEFAYAPEILPLVFSNHTADEQLEVWSCGHRRYCGRSNGGEVFNVRAFGVGVLPVGLTTGLRLSQRVHLRARISAGAVQMSAPIPLAQGTKFNFVADGGVGVEYRASRAVAVSAGVALNHVSNGGLGRVNLGMDSRLFEIGAALSR